MNYKKTEGFFDSSNGFDKIAYYTYVPDCKPKAVLQLCHGMCEYIARYEHFIDYLCGQGYAVIGHDHAGHGNSVSDNSDLGYFALEHGWICLIKDLRKCQLIADDIFGDIPHFIIGHSMGSLILRCYLAKYSHTIDGAVILGTAGKNPATDIGIIYADKEIAFHGVKSRSKPLKKLLFGMSNARIPDRRTEFDWLTRDEKIVADYVADNKCNFTFTSSAFRDLFMLLAYCTDKSWYKKVSHDLPMLVMAGTADPVGDYGRGVEDFYRGLEKNGFIDTELRLWDGCRHELYNETNRLEIYDEIENWIYNRISE